MIFFEVSYNTAIFFILWGNDFFLLFFAELFGLALH